MSKFESLRNVHLYSNSIAHNFLSPNGEDDDDAVSVCSADMEKSLAKAGLLSKVAIHGQTKEVNHILLDIVEYYL